MVGGVRRSSGGVSPVDGTGGAAGGAAGGASGDGASVLPVWGGLAEGGWLATVGGAGGFEDAGWDASGGELVAAA